MTSRRIQPPRLIETEADLKDGIRALRRKCAIARLMHDAAGQPPLRRRPVGLEGLARIVVGQQLSVASAAAIWARTAALVAPFEAATLIATPDDKLRAAGLSTGKIRTLRAASTAVLGGLDLEGMSDHSEAEVHEALTAVSGIGPWTADIYIMFCLGRADGFAPGDLALQVALQMAAGLETRPSANELAQFAERWRPWRSVAAHLLWAYYKVRKETGSAIPV
ncbi:MAG: DNA-3-methyladenine glycosylase 2 family protein [Hyphomicrobiaceae bacterium]